MKLVTFQNGKSRPRAGVLVDGDRKVLDLQAAHRLEHDRPSARLSSVLAMAQSGDEALDLARSLI
ncbi:MAG: fumarylacetoacetate hydrolase family protein, partial [Actinobacteria bacterium]|nr:fumarylacetoacetate hydrolase family protein [Actinomycetota bacterium]